MGKSIVIFDLEATATNRKGKAREIIAIGATLLRKDGRGDYKFNRDFRHFVRPNDLNRVNHLTTEITGITKEVLRSKPYFKTVIHKFIRWLGNEEYYLCSWSPDDFYLLHGDCTRHGVNMEWIQNYNDIQRIYGEKWHPNDKRQIGLQTALLECGFEFKGSKHNALHDALNASRLFKSMLSEADLEKNSYQDVVERYSATKTKRSVALADNRYLSKLKVAKEISKGNRMFLSGVANSLGCSVPFLKKVLTMNRIVDHDFMDAFLVVCERSIEQSIQLVSGDR